MIQSMKYFTDYNVLHINIYTTETTLRETINLVTMPFDSLYCFFFNALIVY